MSNGDDAKFCGHCGTALVRREAYTRQSDQKQMSGSWRCPNWRFDGSGCEGTTVWDPKPKPQQAAKPQQTTQTQQAAPAQPRSATPKSDTERRSIEAQACCKAACELAGRLYAGGGEPCERAAVELAIRAAKRLMREVVLVAPSLEPDYAPSRPGGGTFQFTEDNPPPPEDEDVPNFR